MINNKISITEQQKKFILKAIWNITTLYDFDNTTEKEFKDIYEISKSDLKKESYELSEVLRL